MFPAMIGGLPVQVATNSAQAAERDACETEDADKLKNVALATYKASQASVRSLEAAEAAAEAEKLATEAAIRANQAGTALALNNALATAQAFNEVSCSPPFLGKATTLPQAPLPPQDAGPH